MKSLLSSIFGDASSSSDKKKSDTADLFANPITAPPPRPKKRSAASSSQGPSHKEERSPPKKQKVDKQQVDETTAKAKEKMGPENDPSKTVETIEEEGTIDDEIDDDDNDHNNDVADDRTVFVGNLPVSTKRKDLVRLFKACGKIASTRIRSVATQTEQAVKLPPHQAGNQKLVQQILVNQRKVDTSAKATVQGYVVFADVESVEEALKLNNTPIPVDGQEESSTSTTRRMRVDRVNKEYDARRSVFLGNLPYHADEESLRACFVRARPEWKDPDIHGVRIVRDKETHKCKGFGYLLLADASMVATALRSMDGTDYMGRPLRVRVCGKRFKTKSAADNDRNNNYNGNISSSSNEPRDKPVAASLRQMMTQEQQHQKQEQKQNKRKRGGKKNTASSASSSSGKSKRAASESKTQQRIKKIEKRIRKGMGKTRNK